MRSRDCSSFVCSSELILGAHLSRDRFVIGGDGQLVIGHDRRRVLIDDHDAIAIFLERLDRLRPRIIEFTRLPDDDRAGANDENGGNVGAFGHYCYSSLKASLPTKPRFIGKGDFFSSLSAQSTSSYRASAGGRKRSSFSPLS